MPKTITDDSTVFEISTDLLLDYLEEDHRMEYGLNTSDGVEWCEFRYHMDIDTKQTGATGFVLSASSIKTLVQMGAVRFTHNETGHTVVLMMPEARGDEDRKRLKEAFHAHDRDFEGFGGKDCRRVWAEFKADELQAEAEQY